MSMQQAIEAIIRPPRTTYEINKLPKVLETDDEEDGGGIFIRIPVEIPIPREKSHYILRGSIYHTGMMKISNPGPCVVYMHGNASNQLEGQFLVPNICPHNVFVFCYDSIGCGMSDGEYVSLGYYEQGDVEYLLDFLHSSYGLGPFFLWGRSMGAATAILVNNSYVKGIVADSPFTSIRSMVKAIAAEKGVGKVFMKPTLWMLKNKILEAAGFDINSVSPLDSAKNKEIPIIIAQAKDDKLIPYQHSVDLHKAYKCSNKRLITLNGGHNTRRPLDFIKTGVVFALECLNLPTKGVIISPCRKLMASEFHYESFDTMVSGFNISTFQGAAAKVAKEQKAEDEEDEKDCETTSTASFEIDYEEEGYYVEYVEEEEIAEDTKEKECKNISSDMEEQKNEEKNTGSESEKEDIKEDIKSNSESKVGTESKGDQKVNSDTPDVI